MILSLNKLPNCRTRRGPGHQPQNVAPSSCGPDIFLILAPKWLSCFLSQLFQRSSMDIGFCFLLIFAVLSYGTDWLKIMSRNSPPVVLNSFPRLAAQLSGRALAQPESGPRLHPHYSELFFQSPCLWFVFYSCYSVFILWGRGAEGRTQSLKHARQRLSYIPCSDCFRKL